MRRIKRFIAKARVQTSGRANDAMLDHLLQELSQAKTPPNTQRLHARLRIIRPAAYVASAAVVIIAVAWSVHPGEFPPQRQSAHAGAAGASRISLLTEISLERAFRHGGIQAVEDQCRKALARSTRESNDSSLKTLLAELAEDGKDTGGMSL